MYAIRCGDIDTVKLLIERGADVNIIDYCGYNAAAIVVSEFSVKDMEPYLKLLSEAGCDMNIENNFHLTTKEMYENKAGEEYPY